MSRTTKSAARWRATHSDWTNERDEDIDDAPEGPIPYALTEKAERELGPRVRRKPVRRAVEAEAGQVLLRGIDDGEARRGF